MKNLKSHDKGKTWKVIEKTLTDLGYNIHSRIIDAKLVVPQHRERVFIVGFRDNVSFEFPEIKPTNRKVKDILDKLYLKNIHYPIIFGSIFQDYKEKHRKKGMGSDLEWSRQRIQHGLFLLVTIKMVQKFYSTTWDEST